MRLLKISICVTKITKGLYISTGLSLDYSGLKQTQYLNIKALSPGMYRPFLEPK